MGQTEKVVIVSMMLGLIFGRGFVSEADPDYPHEPIVIETVEPIDISKIEPIEVTSETIPAVEVESEVFPPTTEAPTIAETEPQKVEETIEETEPPEPVRELYLTEEERQMMAQLVHSEGGNESYKVKRLIVDVVFNRVASPEWPNTIEGVIFQRRQFSVIANGSFYRAASQLTEDDWLAVDEECYGRLDYGIVYFNDDSIGGCANGKGGWKEGHMWFAY